MKTSTVVAVIPARMAASRFPGKPIAEIAGLPMIEHVRRRVALSSSVDEVVVATCDAEIADLVSSHGGRAIMTAATHERCTDRVEEAVQQIEGNIVVIVQGDEPLFDPDVLSRLVTPILQNGHIVCTNLLSRISSDADLEDIDNVKAVLDESGNVLAYSRAPIPFRRVEGGCPLYRQTGVSAFTREFLTTFSRLQPTALEITESIDFLRILGHGYPIRAVVWDGELYGVDRPEDVPVVEQVLLSDPAQRAYHERIMAS